MPFLFIIFSTGHSLFDENDNENDNGNDNDNAGPVTSWTSSDLSQKNYRVKISRMLVWVSLQSCLFNKHTMVVVVVKSADDG